MKAVQKKLQKKSARKTISRTPKQQRQAKAREGEPLFISALQRATVTKLLKDDKLFGKFFALNRGFINHVVLSVIGRNKQHDLYDDFFQVASMGLIKALRKYKDGSSKFSTFAYIVMRNDVKQEIKIQQRQKHVLRTNAGDGPLSTYTELSFEDFRQEDTDDTRSSGTWSESKFLETPQIQRLRNFEDELITKIAIEERLAKFTEFERGIYHLHYVKGLSIKKISKQLRRSYSTIKEAFYTRMKPKFEDMLKELQ